MARSKSRSKRVRCARDPCATAERLAANPAGCGAELQVLFDTLVKCEQLPEAIEILERAAGPPMAAKCLLDALLDTPIETPPLQGADFAEVCGRIAEWYSADARDYFCMRARHAMLEYLEECKATIEEIKSGNDYQREQRGVAILDVHFRAGQKAGELVVSGGNWTRVDPNCRGMVPGFCVGVSGYGSNASYRGGGLIEAEVVNAVPLVLKLSGKNQPPMLAQQDGPFRVDRIANRQQFERIIKALFVLCSPEHAIARGRKPSSSLTNVVITKGSGAICYAESDCGRLGYHRPGASKGMNESQCRALSAIPSQTLTLVQGPPGTGKTFLAVQILVQWVNNCARQDNILATSDSNVAVDNLVAGLLQQGVNVVRLGRPEITRANLLEHCADEIACRRLGVSKLQDCTDGQRRHDVMQDIMKGASVIACTSIGAGSGVLERSQFVRVLIDEASQATELASIVPLCSGCEQAVLLGDHCQLPPTVSSDLASGEGLNLSLFERLARTGLKAHLLETQYRMHPAISRFSAQHFYSGRLYDGVRNEHRAPLEGFTWPRHDFPVALVGVAGQEWSEGTSFSNSDEAAMVVEIVADLLRKNQPSDIGVVTPYSAQVRLIRKLLFRAGINAGREENCVEVASVDGFQGREKEGIVMSTVRSSTSRGIGFVADWRRANVAFTRARRCLIVVADARTLAREESTWLPWLHWVRQEGCHVGTSLADLPQVSDRAAPVGLKTLEMSLSSGSSSSGSGGQRAEVQTLDAWPEWEDVKKEKPAVSVFYEAQAWPACQDVSAPRPSREVSSWTAEAAPSADREAKASCRDYGLEEKARRAESRRQAIEARQRERGGLPSRSDAGSPLEIPADVDHQSRPSDPVAHPGLAAHQSHLSSLSVLKPPPLSWPSTAWRREVSTLPTGATRRGCSSDVPVRAACRSLSEAPSRERQAAAGASASAAESQLGSGRAAPATGKGHQTAIVLTAECAVFSGCTMKLAPGSLPPPVPPGCIVFGNCEYEFNGKTYGDEYLVLSPGEALVYLDQEDQGWLFGRRARWANDTLQHPNDDGQPLLGWFPPTAVTSWKIWRPEPNHEVQTLRGFFA